MGKTQMSPSRLKHIKEVLGSEEALTEKQKATLVSLLDEKISGRSENNLAEFHKWIAMGNEILTNTEKELEQLRSLTCADGDTISKSAMLDILTKYYNNKPKNEVDNGVNWVIDKMREDVEKLHTM